MTEAATRIDKWLWYARFFKSRSRATDYCQEGSLRVNGVRIGKAHHLVRPGDVLTFAIGRSIRVVRIVSVGVRRGPAPEAQALYEDLAPPAAPSGVASPTSTSPPQREAGAGRPTKAERRATDRLRDRD